MSALVFMDTETTGLSLDDDIWEFAAIRREEDGTETEHHIFIEHDRLKCTQLPTSFRDDHYARYLDHLAYTSRQAAQYISDVFRNGKPHVVGAVPNFDTERIARLVAGQKTADDKTYGPLGWHYHLIDVENLAVGFLAGRIESLAGRIEAGSLDDQEATDGVLWIDETRSLITPPWDSDALSRACGVEPPTTERHTAMGDVRWAMAIFDAIAGGAS